MLLNLLIFYFTCLFSTNIQAQIAPPLINQGAYQTGIYRNLFATINKTPSEIQAKLDNAWLNYFASSDNNSKLYYTFDSDEAYILNPQENDIRSEGMSYGMMIAVQMNKPNEFDKLWRFAKTRMKNTTGDNQGYFCWQVRIDGSCIDSAAAPDGEEYFAMSLLFAANRWNNDIYRNDALLLLQDMLHKPKSGIINPMFNLSQKQVVFSPVGTGSEFTNPSYHMPAFYHLFSLWGPAADKSIWEGLRDNSRNFLNLTAKEPYCLAPEYANFDGTPHAGYNRATNSYTQPEQMQFRNDAWRTVFNWSIDYAWFAADARQSNLSNCILSFFADNNKSGGLAIDLNGNYIANYWQYNNLDGSLNNNVLPNLNTLTGGINYKAWSGLIAMNATGVLASSSKDNAPLKFVHSLWTANMPQGTYRYYDGMLYMLGLLATSGQYKIYAPSLSILPTNKILNGSFSNQLLNWNTALNNNASATFNIQNEKMYIQITAGNFSHNVQLIQPVSVLKNKSYQLEFDARITEGYSSTLYAGFEKGGTNTMYATTRFSLKPNVQHFKYIFNIGTFTMNDTNAKLKFLMGSNNNDIEIDNIQLLEM